MPGVGRAEAEAEAEAVQKTPGGLGIVPVAGRGSRRAAGTAVPRAVVSLLPDPVLDRARVAAAHARPAVSRRGSVARDAPRPRVEVSVNELTGMMSWRTVRPPAAGAGNRPGAGPRRDRTAPAPPGVRPATSEGAAPLPTNPADVRAAVNVSVASLPPEHLRRHLAVVAVLRSHVKADLALGARLPRSVAAPLRAAATPASVHALGEERADTTRELGRRSAAARPVPQVTAPARGRHR
ncbi:hypothetical protein ACGFS9_27580 [Streptomyces sp. NPDC048566]|uniref:hypothetical protein n=1 Tax=Streptomyces sp. NPDC048566 TaxID=3365569 RepID=UPI0037208B33